MLQLHLGPSTRHTVYKAKIVATILGVELLQCALRCMENTSIGLDNTAAIQASKLCSLGAGCYLTDMFHAAVWALKQMRPQLRLTLHWVPGHTNMPGNEAANSTTKDTVPGLSSDTSKLLCSLRKPLLLSTTWAQQN